MAGAGSGPQSLTGAFLNEQAQAAQTASDLTSLDPSELVGDTPSQVPFYDYITAAAASRSAAAAGAQQQLDAAIAAENANPPPAGFALAQIGYQIDALQNTIASDDQVAGSLTGLADAMEQQDQAGAIQQFKLDTAAENADFFTLATLDNQSEITLGMLDTNA